MRAYTNDPDWPNRKLDGYGERTETGTVPGAANDYTVELDQRIVPNGTLTVTVDGTALTVVPWAVAPTAGQAAVSYELPLVKVHSSREGGSIEVTYDAGGGVLSSGKMKSIPQGDPGEGVPIGGTAGQVLAKIDSTDYNTEWVDQTGGGAVDSVNGQTGAVDLDGNDIFVGPFTPVSGGSSNVEIYLRPDSAGTGVEFGDASDLSPSIVIPIANVTNLTTELAGKLTATTTSPAAGQVIWYNGTAFVNGPVVTTSGTEPSSPAEGDIWFDMSGV